MVVVVLRLILILSYTSDSLNLIVTSAMKRTFPLVHKVCGKNPTAKIYKRLK